MNTESHTVTLPIRDYNKLLAIQKEEEGKRADMKKDLDALGTRSREFVSALAFLEDHGLLAEFNTHIAKKYALVYVGLNKEVRMLKED